MVVDAHSHKEQDASYNEDDAGGDVGEVIVLVVVIEAAWRWAKERRFRFYDLRQNFNNYYTDNL